MDKDRLSFLEDLTVFRDNQIPAHSDHLFYNSLQELQGAQPSGYESLDGTWDFHFCKSLAERDPGFYKQDSTVQMTSITVPGHMELQGFGDVQYINTMYPWDGLEHLRPPQVPQKLNSVGQYVRYFDLPKRFAGKRVFIQFQGVEQAMYLYLNGQYVGYAEDSFTPSEFELTPYLQETGNKLAVECFKRSKAAYVEDQDFFRFSGIFRPVVLYAVGECHVQDMWAKTDYLHDLGTLDLRIRLLRDSQFAGSVGYTLCDDQDRQVAAQTLVIGCDQFSFSLRHDLQVKPYSYEEPVLYQLLVTIYDKQGTIVELVPYQIGFRHVEIRDAVVYLNGKRLLVCGVNRHEWSAHNGRVISMEEMHTDMQIIKRNNINMVRTCHYPDNIAWYYLCDANGIYLMAENNLESHGSWQKMGAVEPSWNVPGDKPEWEALVVDRARTNFETFKNHVSILIWSLGNESYAGSCIAAMNKFYKDMDDTRLVHYEGVFHAPKLKATISDLESHMYSSPDTVRAYLDDNPAKPFVLCEYMHSMGNSVGGLDSYDKLFDEYPSYLGGLIWDFIDQALYVSDAQGNEHLRYGGDFNEKASDYEFSADGIVFADRQEKPVMQEVRYIYGNRLGRC